MYQPMICKQLGLSCASVDHVLRFPCSSIEIPSQPARRASQHKMCKYLRAKCQSPSLPPFLRLPPQIRVKIYIYAGLITENETRCELYLSARTRPSYFYKDFEFDASYNIPLVCRTVYAEATSILYSRNRILIFKGNLRLLRNLSPTALSSLTHLEVINRATSRPTSGDPWPLENRPLRDSSFLSQPLLEEWDVTIRHVLKFTKPSRLRLRLACDVADAETGIRVLEPLNHASSFASCDIRLHHRPEPRLQELASRAAAHATGYTTQIDSPFRFLDLPPELRSNVLQYTDLVTPLSEIEWSPDSGFRLRYRNVHCFGEWHCPGLYHADKNRFRACDDEFCQRHYAAISTECNCWAPPLSLFLVCQKLRKSALEIFWGQNRFIIAPSYSVGKVPVSLDLFFAEVVPPQALRSLRFLEVAFPMLQEECLRLSHTEWESWLRPIAQAKHELNLPRLTLRLCLSDSIEVSLSSRSYFGFYEYLQDLSSSLVDQMTTSQRDDLLNMYKHVLTPLSELPSLQRFFVHFDFPFPATKRGTRNGYLAHGPDIEVKLEIEKKLERLVKGNNYCSTSVGKLDVGRSQWFNVLLDKHSVM